MANRIVVYETTTGRKTANTSVTMDLFSLASATSTRPLFTLSNSNADANGALFRFSKSTPSSGDDDNLGTIYAEGRDSANAAIEFAHIKFYSSDITSTDAGGEITMRVMVDSTLSNMFNINGYNGSVGQGEIVFNKDNKDIDFTISAADPQRTHMFHIDATTRSAGVCDGDWVAGSFSGNWNVLQSGDNNWIYHDTYAATAGYCSNLVMRKSDSNTIGTKAQTDDGHNLGQIQAYGVDSGSNFDYGGYIRFIQDGAASTKVPTNMLFSTYSDTAENTNQFVLHNDGAIGMGTAAPTEQLHITSATSAKPRLLLENTTDDATGPSLEFRSDRATPADADVIGTIVFDASDSGGTQTEVVQIIGSIEETADGDEAGKFEIKIMHDDGTPALDSFLMMRGDKDAVGQGEIVFNKDNNDIDFTISGGDPQRTHLFHTDATTRQVGICVGDWVAGSFGGNFNVLQSADNNTINLDTYGTVAGYQNILSMRKSDSNTIGTKAQTDDTDALGQLQVQGVDNGSNFDGGGYIRFIQDGAASTKVPTNMLFSTCSDTAENTNQLVLHNDGSIGFGTATPGYPLHLVAASSPSLVIEDSTNTVQARLYSDDSNSYAGGMSNHPFIIQSNNTAALTVKTDQHVVTAQGVMIGADSTNNEFDDASSGAGSTTMYIGNGAITVTFTGKHYYQLGDLDLEKGELVKLVDRKIYRVSKKQDQAASGIFWGITNFQDSFCTKFVKYKTIDFIQNSGLKAIEVPPENAFETCEETTEKDNGYTIQKKYLLDRNEDKVIYHDVKIPKVKKINTGKFYKKLKQDIKLNTENGKLYKTSIDKEIVKKETNEIIRISDGQPAQPEDFAYSIACLGDSYDEHDKQPLTGAWVTVDAGTIKNGDYLCSSVKAGYLEKQADTIQHNYTRAIAREDINADTKTAYVYLL